MRDSVSVFTSCSPRMAVSRTGSQYGVSMQWAAVTWDKAGYAMNLWTVTVTSHWEFSSAAPQLGLREPFLLRPTIQGYSLTSTLWPPTTRCLMFFFPQTENNYQHLQKQLTTLCWWIRLGRGCWDCFWLIIMGSSWWSCFYCIRLGSGWCDCFWWIRMGGGCCC